MKKILVIGSIVLISIIILNKEDKKELIKNNIKIENTIAMYKSDDKTNYTEINEMPESGYIINESKSYCNKSDGTKDTTAILKTINNNHTISGLKKNNKCYVWFDKILTGSDIILNNITVNTGTPNFANATSADEGVYKVSDGMYGGYSYYFRGAVTNNYVKFAGKCWRIIRINGDSSIRLIYDGATCNANGANTTASVPITRVEYNSKSGSSEYVGYTYTLNSQRPTSTASGTASTAKVLLESWYSSNITGTDVEKVAEGKYCNDRNVWSGTWSIAGSEFTYAPYTRLYTNKSPSLSCISGDTYILNVGTITADEVAFAGGVNSKSNQSYYLYNGQSYWTMSPSRWEGSAYGFVVMANGSLDAIFCRVNNDNFGIRPVINLKADITFNSGNGTLDNPYVVA